MPTAKPTASARTASANPLAAAAEPPSSDGAAAALTTTLNAKLTFVRVADDSPPSDDLMDGERKGAFDEPAAELTAESKIVKCDADKGWGDGRTDRRV